MATIVELFGGEFEFAEALRQAFEKDAAIYGFDLTRSAEGRNLGGEPWSEYHDPATGHRWGGWLALACWAIGDFYTEESSDER